MGNISLCNFNFVYNYKQSGVLVTGRWWWSPHDNICPCNCLALASPLRWDEASLNMIKFANSVEVSHKKLASFPCKLFNAYVNFLCKIWIVPQNITCGDKIIRPLAKCFALHCRAILFNSAQLATIIQDRSYKLVQVISQIHGPLSSCLFLCFFIDLEYFCLQNR